jgi:uncharacterized iron-regulated membrane protein
MRWMMIAFLVSLGALLLAAAGAARHIWLQRTRLHSNPDAGAATVPKHSPKAVLDPVEESDQDL